MKFCLDGFDEDWNAQANTKDSWCRGSSFIENNIQVGGRYMRPNAEVKGPFSEVDMNGSKYVCIINVIIYLPFPPLDTKGSLQKKKPFFL